MKNRNGKHRQKPVPSPEIHTSSTPSSNGEHDFSLNTDFSQVELVVNPAVSEAQRRYLNATKGHDWVKEHDFDNKGPLPEKVKKPSAREKRRAVANRKNVPNPVKLDPSRTLGLRRPFILKIRQQFAKLKFLVRQLVVKDDAFGLTTNRDLRAEIQLAALRADTNPSQAQKEAGNYKHGHVTIQGLPITIETAKGVKRQEWHDKPLAAHYGYIKRTLSEADGDHVDVFIGPNPDSERMWIIDQLKVTENSNPNHDESGRFTSGEVHLPIKEDWSDLSTLRGQLQEGNVEDGWHIAEPKVVKVQEGKIEVQKHLKAEYNRDQKRYVITQHEPEPEPVKPRSLLEDLKLPQMSEEHLKKVQDLARKLTDELPEKMWTTHHLTQQYQQGTLGKTESGLDELARGKRDKQEGEDKNIGQRTGEHFQPVREMLKELVGDHVTMYRGADPVGGVLGKKLSSYAADPNVAAKFLEGYDVNGNPISKVLKEVSVPVDAIYMAIKSKDRPLEFKIDNDKLPKYLATNLSQEDFDEHKCLIGFDSEEQAVQAYKDSYYDGWPVGDVTEMSMDEFKRWLKEGDTSKPLANSNPEGHNQYSFTSITKAVTRLAHSALFSKLNALQLKHIDTWLMEQASNSQHPGSVLAAKVALSVALRGINEVSKRVTNEKVDEGIEDHDVEDAIAALARVLGLPVINVEDINRDNWKYRKGGTPDEKFVMQYFTPVRNSNPEGCNQHTGPGCSSFPDSWHSAEDILRVSKTLQGTIVGGAAYSIYTGIPSKDVDVMTPLDEHEEQNIEVDGVSVQKVPFGEFKAGGRRVDLSKLETEVVKGVEVLSPVSLLESTKNNDPHALNKAVALIRSQNLPKETVRKLSNGMMLFMEAWHKVHGGDLDESLADWKKLIRNKPTTNEDFSSSTDAKKITAFQSWLSEQMDSTIRGKSQEQLWKRYVHQGFSKGAGRSFDDVRRGAKGRQRLDFYDGTRDEFLSSSFNQPEAIEKVQLLSDRTFDELENVTTDMSNRMSRVLTDGLIRGQSPIEVARYLDDAVDLGRGRTELVARTELLRAHNEGQLLAMEGLGVTHLGVAVEWLATDDGKACPRCQVLEGVVLKISEAHGLLPLHPDCRCCWTPGGVVFSDDDQKTSKEEIDAAFAEAGIEDREISPKRPVENENPNHDEKGRFTAAVDSLETLKGDRAKVPFPVVDKDVPNASPWLDKQLFGEGVQFVHEGEARDAKIKEVPMDQLHATQPHVYKSQLNEMHSNPPNNEIPLVIKHGGKYLIHDGTHRATIAKLKGDKTLKAWVWDADDLTNNENPQGCNQWTGPGCGTGEGLSKSQQRIISKFHSDIDSQDHLSDQQKTAYKGAISRVLSRMTSSAAEYVEYGVKKVEWHSDMKTLTASKQAVERAAGLSPDPTEKVAGTYNFKEKLARLDGETPKRNALGMGIKPGEVATTIHGTYAHELTHALDDGFRVSKTEEWQEAYKSEIRTSDSVAPLSEYARMKNWPHEGFAEFGRALFGSDVPHKTLKAQFPKSFAFFARRGFVKDVELTGNEWMALNSEEQAIPEAFTAGGFDPKTGQGWDGFKEVTENSNPNHDELGRFSAGDVDIEGREPPPEADIEHYKSTVAKIEQAALHVLKTVDHKFLEEAGVLNGGKLSVRISSHHDAALQKRGLTGTEGGFADDDKITLMATRDKQEDVTHTLVHEIAHKWEKTHNIADGDEAYQWANIGDVSRLSPEDKSRWGYVASPGNEPLVEAIAQSLHPHDRSFSSTSKRFLEHFPKSVEIAKQHLKDKGIAVNSNSEGCNQHTGPGCSIGASKARVTIKPDQAAKVNATLQSIFGRKVEPEEIASMIGALDDAKVVTRPGEEEGQVRVSVEHPKYHARRVIFKDEDGKAVIENKNFQVKEEDQNSGIGAKVFASQVENAAKSGVDRLETHAAGSPGSEMNGYYTWPRFGYNQKFGEIDSKWYKDKEKTISEKFPEAKSVSDVMRTQEGRDWWKANGFDLPNAKFDLKDGSLSRKVLKMYLEEKSKKGTNNVFDFTVNRELSEDEGDAEECPLTAEDEAALDRSWKRLEEEEKK